MAIPGAPRLAHAMHRNAVMRRTMFLWLSLAALAIGSGVLACANEKGDEPVTSSEPDCPAVDDPQPTSTIAPTQTATDAGDTVTVTPEPCIPSRDEGSSASSTSGATTTSGGENSSSGKLAGTTSGVL